nr:hypothetical protein [Mesorhizobium escarrei]
MMVPTALRPHHRQHGTAHAERAAHIGVDVGGEVAQRLKLDRARYGDTGIVDQNVDAPG